MNDEMKDDLNVSYSGMSPKMMKMSESIRKRGAERKPKPSRDEDKRQFPFARPSDAPHFSGTG